MCGSGFPPTKRAHGAAHPGFNLASFGVPHTSRLVPLPTPPPLPRPVTDLHQPGSSDDCSLTRPGSSLSEGHDMDNVSEAPAAKKHCAVLGGRNHPAWHAAQQRQQECGDDGIGDGGLQRKRQEAGGEDELVHGVDAEEAEAVEALLAAASGSPLTPVLLRPEEISAGGSPRRTLQHEPAALREFMALHAAFNLPARRQHVMTASLRMLQCYRDAALEDRSHSEQITAHTHRYAVLLRLLASGAPQEQTSITPGVVALAKRFLRELCSFRCLARRNMQGAGQAEQARASGTALAAAPCDTHELQEARARAAAAEQHAAAAEAQARQLWLCVQSLQHASRVAPAASPAADNCGLQQQLAVAQAELSALREERQLVMAAGQYAMQLRQDMEQEAEAVKQQAWAGAASLCRQMHEAYLLQQQQTGEAAGAVDVALQNAGRAAECSNGPALSEQAAGASKQAEPRSSKGSATAPPQPAAAPAAWLGHAASAAPVALQEMQQQAPQQVQQ